MNQVITIDEVKRQAAMRWPEIHAALGIPRQYLNNRKHQPCPHCGGKDRYRYTDYQGGGGFICNQCTPQGGSGFDLIMLVFGCDFQTAFNRVAALLGMGRDNGEVPLKMYRPDAAQPAEQAADKQAKLLFTWEQAQPLREGDAVLAYLRRRGLNIQQQPRNLRFHPALPYWIARGGGYESIGRYPAMLAAITTANGELQGLHETYLEAVCDKPYGEDGAHIPSYTQLNINHPDTGEPLPAKKMQTRYTGALSGAAIHLYGDDGDDVLCVAEGIESAFAARELFGLPVWACLSAGGMKSLALPSGLKELVIAADNDKNQTGIRAAEMLIRRAIQSGITARIWQSDTSGFDPLEHLNKMKRSRLNKTSDGHTQNKEN